MVRFAKNKFVLRVACLFVTMSFLSNAVMPAYVRAQDLVLPAPTQFVNLSESYSFPILKGLRFDPKDPFKMSFLIDTADQKKVSEEEASLLVRYFLAGLAIPDEQLWVNMSPYEGNKMIMPSLSETDLGKDLLSQDYILKQISSSLTYPESDTGKDYWAKTYQEVQKVANTTRLPVNTFNKIWIMPDKAEVYENGNIAVVAEASLKAMLEEDYLALKNNVTEIQKKKKNMKEALIEKVNEASSNVMREVILPKINKEVNSGKNFATLRQIYYSLIVAAWFKQKFQDSIYRYYIDKGKVKGIDLQDKNAKDKIYKLYIEAFQKGVYNYIKTDYEPASRRKIKRQYFSGGAYFPMGQTTNFTKVADSTLSQKALEGGPITEATIKINPNLKTAESPIFDDPLLQAISAKRTPIIGGNWKMALGTKEEARELLMNLANEIGENKNVEIFVAPSFVHIPIVSQALRELESEGKIAKGLIKLGAQNMYAEEKGAFTGGISAQQLIDMGVTHVILGHSEVRRNLKQELTGESNANVNRKLKTALKYGLTPIICVGESIAERKAGKTKDLVGEMIRESLKDTPLENAAKIVVAYEPVWAIGTGLPAEPEQAKEEHTFIRGELVKMFEDAASKIRIQYGGSVTDINIAGYMAVPGVDGALVGGQSLKPKNFAGIVKGAAETPKLSSSPAIRTELTVPEGQKKDFFTNDYHSYTISELFTKPIEQIPDAVVAAVQNKLNRDIAEGKILSAVVKDFGGTDIDIQVTHRFGALNTAVQRLIIEAMKEGCLKAQELGLIKKTTALTSMSLADLSKALRVKYQLHSITERGSEPVVIVKIIGAGIGAANIKLYHEFFVPGATPLQKLGYVPVVNLAKDKLPVRGFRAVVRRTEDILKGNFDGPVWEFEKSAALKVTTKEKEVILYPSKDESLELMALASQPNDYVITAIYSVEGSTITSTEPLVSLVYQPVYGEKGYLRPLNPTFICRSQSGADAVGGIASMFYDVNFVPGGPKGENVVATRPVTLNEARKAPKEGTANVVVYGWQSKGYGIIPKEKDGIIDHVAINPPALNPERKLADWLASIMTTHKKDQPYIAPFAAQKLVEPLRKAMSKLFSRAPKEADIDPIMDKVEAKVASGEYLSVTDDKADMGGKFGHNFTPEYMLAIDRATVIEAQEKGELSDGNIIGFLDKGRLKNGTTPSVGDDSHVIMIGDKSRNSAFAHQLSFLAFTRGYLFAVVNGEKPYGLAQDYQGKEAKAAKKNPYFYSHLTPRFFEIVKEVMPQDHMAGVYKMEEGWKEWQETKKETILPEPFSGNVSQQGIGSARYLVDIAAGERSFGVLAGDKMGPAALNRVIREGVDAALATGEFKNGLVYEIWDAKAFDEHGNIPIDELPESFADVADAITSLKDQDEQNFVRECYGEDGLLREHLRPLENQRIKDDYVGPYSKDEALNLATLLKKAGYVPTKRILFDALQDKEAVDIFLADSDRFNVKQVWEKIELAWDNKAPQGYLWKPVLGSSVTKLGILAGGEYIGKDDPVMIGSMKLMKHIYEFLRLNPLIIQGDMNGSHWLAAIPTAFKYAVANKESHPILVGLVYTVADDGKTLASVEDVFEKKEFAPIRNKMFKFNFEFKKAQIGGQFEPYATNWRTVEASYPLAKLLKALNEPDSPFLIKNKPEAERQLRPIGLVNEMPELFKMATAASSIRSEQTSASSAIVTNAEEAGAPYGGIDLGGVKVKATPNSIPVNMPAINLEHLQGFTFQIIKMEPIINPGSIFGTFQKVEDNSELNLAAR